MSSNDPKYRFHNSLKNWAELTNDSGYDRNFQRIKALRIFHNASYFQVLEAVANTVSSHPAHKEKILKNLKIAIINVIFIKAPPQVQEYFMQKIN